MLYALVAIVWPGQPRGHLVKLADRMASIWVTMASTIIAVDGGTSKLFGMKPTAKGAIVDVCPERSFPEARDIPSDITAPNFIPNIGDSPPSILDRKSVV